MIDESLIPEGPYCYTVVPGEHSYFKIIEVNGQKETKICRKEDAGAIMQRETKPCPYLEMIDGDGIFQNCKAFGYEIMDGCKSCDVNWGEED